MGSKDAFPGVNIDSVRELAEEATKLAKQAGEVAWELAEKGSPNERDGLIVNALFQLSSSVTNLGQNVQALAYCVKELGEQ